MPWHREMYTAVKLEVVIARTARTNWRKASSLVRFFSVESHGQSAESDGQSVDSDGQSVVAVEGVNLGVANKPARCLEAVD